MSSFYDRWGRLARYCKEAGIRPELACEMARQRLQQAKAYYAWVSKRRDAKKIKSPDPMADEYNDAILLTRDWLYADALEEAIGKIPREDGFYAWAETALSRMHWMTRIELYGKPAQFDWTPWGLFTQQVLMTLHSFAHYVGMNSPYSDNPYKFSRRIPDWVDADAWCKEHGFPE